jgi:hypothetical protein
MEEMELRMRMASEGLAMDVVAIFAFISFAAIYVIAPVIGYREERPTGMISALYLLIGFAGLSLIQMLANIGLTVVSNDGAFGRNRTFDARILVSMVFPVFKAILLVLAMTNFVRGLRTLRLKANPERRDAPPARNPRAESIQKPIGPADPV